jgi:hypothetical protein
MRLSGALLAMALLGSCTSGPLEGGRYSCTFDGGEPSDQCPGDWRCGLEGYCHHYNDTSVAWRCVNDDQCELRWTCGLDPSRDGGECHDPQSTTPWPCETDQHCTSGWHCGPAGTCYDRQVPAAHACRSGAGDCADGWRCGLKGLCQNLDAGAAYPCGLSDGGLEDSWCERGWRCAPEGVCLDPAQDALLADPSVTVGGAVKINPLTSSSPIAEFAVSPVYATGPGRGMQTTAFVQDSKLQATVSDRTGTGSAIPYVLGPWRGRALATLGSRGEHGYLSNDVPDEETRIFAALEDAGVDLFTLSRDGGWLAENLDLQTPVTRFSMGSAEGNLAPRVMAFSDIPSEYRRLGGDGWVVYGNVFTAANTGDFDAVPGNRLVDAVSVRPQNDLECIFAVDSRGLWSSQRSSGTAGSWDFEQIELPPFTNDSCGPPGADSLKITGLAPYGRDWMGVSSVRLDGGETQVAVLDLRPLWARTPDTTCTSYNSAPCASDDRIPVGLSFGPCPACPGGRLLDYAIAVDAFGKPSLELRCGSEDGGTSGFFSVSSRAGTASCERIVADGQAGVFGRPDLVRADERVPGQVSWGSVDGYVWAGGKPSEVTSQLFDRAASTVARRSARVEETIAFTPEIAGVPSPLGLETKFSSDVVTGVEGEPEWVITRDRQVLSLSGASFVGDARLIGFVGSSVTPFAAPHSAASAKSGSMNKLLVVAAGSSVFSAELDGAPGGVAPTLSLRVVSPSQIDSIAFPPRAPVGVYLRGYAVTPNGLLRLTAETSNRWTFAPVALPSSLEPLEVWFESDRGRVGFSDGTVYSLPSRVPIAAGLTGGVAIDYAQACGQQFVLGTSGLFRLESVAGKAIGQWKQVALPNGFASRGFVKGRIHGVGGGLYVFTRTGEAARVALDSCPAP